jgi:hypothetical protein
MWRLSSWSPSALLAEPAPPEGEGVAGVRWDFEGSWSPRRPALHPPESWPPITLVDGRQQVDAVLVDASGKPGVLAQLVVGTLRRGERSLSPQQPWVKRLFVHPLGASPAPVLDYMPQAVPAQDLAGVLHSLPNLLRGMEAEVINRQEGLVLIDGQIYPGTEPFARPLLGYTKSLVASYLPLEAQRLLPRLEPGERTPIFFIPGYGLGRKLDVFSWYLRLPLEPSGLYHPWSSLVRVETPTLEPSEAVALADLSVSLLTAFASTPLREARAPQNLLPIGGLEAWLGRYLIPSELARRRILKVLGGGR